MTFTSCCSISCPNDREKLGRLWGNYLARDVRNSFKLIPILTPGSPLRLRTLLQLRPHQLPPHVPSTFGFHRTTCDYALFRSYFGTDCFAGAATRRPPPDRHDTLANAIGERLHPRHPLPSIKSFPRLFRSISLADFRSDRPRTDAVRIFRPTWNRSLRPAPLHAATAPNPSKTPTASLASAKD